MSIININRNIFLEKEELVKFQDFMINNVTQQVVLENTTNWGVVRSVFTGIAPDFLVEAGTNSGTVKIATASKAVDSDKLLIKQAIIDNIAIPTADVFYWMKISHQYSNLEVGTCNVNVNGEVSGSGTKFTEVVRGQSTEVPVKIKFYKASGTLLNNQIYETVDVTDDSNILLSGAGFVAETGLNYIVIGSTPVGETITSGQQNGLYQYDSCKIDFVLETTLDTSPAGLVTDKEFWIARVKNVSGTVSITDKRTEYLTFNVEGVGDKLAKSENLNDLPDKAIARANLGVLSITDVQNSFFDDSGWLPMTKGSKISATNYSLNIRRIGKNCIVQGRMTIGPTELVDNDIVASIPYSSLANTVTGYSYQNNSPTYFSSSADMNSSEHRNLGFGGIVPQKSAPEDYFKLVVLDSSGANQNMDLSINFSLFLD